MNKVKWSISIKDDAGVDMFVSSCETLYHAISEAILAFGQEHRSKHIPSHTMFQINAYKVTKAQE